MPGGWGMGPGGHIGPFPLCQVQHKHVLQHKVVAATVYKQLAACMPETETLQPVMQGMCWPMHALSMSGKGDLRK